MPKKKERLLIKTLNSLQYMPKEIQIHIFINKKIINLKFFDNYFNKANQP